MADRAQVAEGLERAVARARHNGEGEPASYILASAIVSTRAQLAFFGPRTRVCGA